MWIICPFFYFYFLFLLIFMWLACRVSFAFTLQRNVRVVSQRGSSRLWHLAPRYFHLRLLISSYSRSAPLCDSVAVIRCQSDWMNTREEGKYAETASAEKESKICNHSESWSPVWLRIRKPSVGKEKLCFMNLMSFCCCFVIKLYSTWGQNQMFQ